MREYDTIDDGTRERRSAVEELAEFVLGIVRAYFWFVVGLFVFLPLIGLLVVAVKHVF